MRLVHLAELAESGHVVPRCGEWGSMDTDWTDREDGATCAACKAAPPMERAARAAGDVGRPRRASAS